MVYLHEIDAIHAREQAFPYKNCYGLSQMFVNVSIIPGVFPYNELLWFILYGGFLLVRDIICFRTTNCYGLSEQVTEILNRTNEFPYNELLWFIVIMKWTISTGKSFRTTNCYGLSYCYTQDEYDIQAFPYNELLWFISRQYNKKTCIE